MIKFDHVSKTYPTGRHAVTDLSLVVDDGQICVLVGPSGCGKTTTLKMINRLVEPTSGTITIDGVDGAPGGVSQIRAVTEGRQFLVQPAFDEHITDFLRPAFQKVYTMSFDNYPVEMERIRHPEVVKSGARN